MGFCRGSSAGPSLPGAPTPAKEDAVPSPDGAARGWRATLRGHPPAIRVDPLDSAPRAAQMEGGRLPGHRAFILCALMVPGIGVGGRTQVR